MVDDASVVEADEDVLRRVVCQQQYFDPALDIPVQRYAFKPMPNDTHGISVFRKRFIAPSALATAGPNPAGYVIAALCVRDINSIDLKNVRMSVVADRNDDLPGHALIPELNITTPKPLAKEMQVRLAQLASRRIVYTPDHQGAA